MPWGPFVHQQLPAMWRCQQAMLRVNQREYVQRAEALIQEVSECLLNHHCMALHRLPTATHNIGAKATGGRPTGCHHGSTSRPQPCCLASLSRPAGTSEQTRSTPTA